VKVSVAAVLEGQVVGPVVELLLVEPLLMTMMEPQQGVVVLVSAAVPGEKVVVAARPDEAGPGVMVMAMVAVPGGKVVAAARPVEAEVMVVVVGMTMMQEEEVVVVVEVSAVLEEPVAAVVQEVVVEVEVTTSMVVVVVAVEGQVVHHHLPEGPEVHWRQVQAASATLGKSLNGYSHRPSMTKTTKIQSLLLLIIKRLLLLMTHQVSRWLQLMTLLKRLEPPHDLPLGILTVVPLEKSIQNLKRHVLFGDETLGEEITPDTRICI
jgi:hypothetical protein